MKIGPRIALATSILVALSLGGYGLLTLRARRAELEADLERLAVDHALVVAGALEAEAGRDGGDPLALALKLARRQGGASLHILALDRYYDERAPQDA